MDRIATEVERDPNYKNIMHAQRTEPEATGADAISAAARQIAETLHLAAICCYTSSGATALRAARERPETPIIALSPVLSTARRLSLVWGLHWSPVPSRTPRGHDLQCLPGGAPRGLCQARRADHRYRRRAARQAGRDQHAQGCFRRGEQRG